LKPRWANIGSISFVCTAKCGNGVCDTNIESNYNCPQDCEESEKCGKCANHCEKLPSVSDCQPTTENFECIYINGRCEKIPEIKINLNIMIENETKLIIQLSNGGKTEIKIMPDTASERAIGRLRLKVCNETNNCTIQLKEVGGKAVYEIQVQRHYRILGLFKVKAQNKAEVDAETGEIKVKKPWWSFLATSSN
jgi:hypothetical protein